MSRISLQSLVLACSILLAACGGGGGGGAPFLIELGGTRIEPEGTMVALGGAVTNNNGVVTYAWTQTAGPVVALSSTITASPTFESMAIPANTGGTTLRFSVTATDAVGNVSTDTLRIDIESADYAIFLSDMAAGLATDLYAYDPRSGTQTRLSLLLGGNSSVNQWDLTANRQAAVFRNGVGAQSRLYVAAIDGSSLIAVSPLPLPGTSGLGFWEESPLGGVMGYVGVIEHATASELYAVNSDGTGLSTLLTAAGPWQDVYEFSWVPDASQLVARGELVQDGVIDLVSVGADGSSRTQVNKALVAGGFVDDFELNLDGTLVAYAASADSVGVSELYIAGIAGTASTKLSGPMVMGGDILSYSWTADGSRIVYAADEDTDGVFEAFSVLPDGTGNVKLNAPLGAGQSLLTFDFTADGTRLFYIADQDSMGVFEAYTVLNDGTGRVKLNPAMIGAGDVQGAFSMAGSTRIVFSADSLIDGVPELYAVDNDGANRIRLTTGLGVGSTGLVSAVADGASDRIAYLADEDTPGVIELYTVLSSGLGKTKLSGLMVAGGNAQSAFMSPTGSHVAYIADQDVVGELDVYCVRVDGTQLVRLTATVPAATGFTPIVGWSDDGALLVIDGFYELGGIRGGYVVAPDGTGFTRVLDPVASGPTAIGTKWSLPAE